MRLHPLRLMRRTGSSRQVVVDWLRFVEYGLVKVLHCYGCRAAGRWRPGRLQQLRAQAGPPSAGCRGVASGQLCSWRAWRRAICSRIGCDCIHALVSERGL